MQTTLLVADGASLQRMTFGHDRGHVQPTGGPARHALVIVGAGPVGLSLAIDLAQRGQQVLLLDDDDRLSTGSRAICFAQRTLEIWNRLGTGDASAAKGVSWSVGRVFLGNEQVYHFDLLPDSGHERPAFVNLQQYYVEAQLLHRAQAMSNIEIRWKNKVIGVEPAGDGEPVRVDIQTPEGAYALEADYLIACDGGRSAVRRLMGLESKGRTFQDRFLIADVKMAADFPAERWFWFDPPFHPNQSVLLHRQPDNVWRIDFQLGWDADPEEEKLPERITPRVNALMRQALGREVPFELEWASVYTFSCLRMERFRHGQVLFAGDSAHGVSPFGARGANSGVQDADNLAWKLAAVLEGRAGQALLDSYGIEREFAADENILNSTRATDFITPKDEMSKLFRNATLELSRDHAFARRFVNSGRLSVPTVLGDSPLNTPDRDVFEGAMHLGSAAMDAPLTKNGEPVWLLRELGQEPVLLVFGTTVPGHLRDTGVNCVGVLPQGATAPNDGNKWLADHEGLFASRYDAKDGSVWLLRPDQHLCARWRAPSKDEVLAAFDRLYAKEPA